MELYQIIGPKKEATSVYERYAQQHWELGKTWMKQLVVKKVTKPTNEGFVYVDIVVAPKSFAPVYDETKRIRLPQKWLKRIK